MYKYLKRIIDLLLAVVLLVILFIPMVIIAIAIKLDSKGPVFFKQKRTGKNGKEFTLYKFRSMAIENDVHDFKNADKHTRVGSFIRKTSLDELGQIINILNGTMSFIGPRPWITDYWDNMNEEQRHRCDVKPGITGLAQVMGRNDITIFDKINYDLEYVKSYSFIEDVKIVFLTVKAVFSEKGADAGKNTIKNELSELKKANKKKVVRKRKTKVKVQTTTKNTLTIKESKKRNADKVADSLQKA